MKKLFLAGCAVLLLATGAAHAIEYQGRLPKPVQKLPAYPPVVCVAPNWATESCADRRTAQYWQERDAKAARLWEEWQQARQQHEAKGPLEKFISPSRCESDSLTARGSGRMERASHGAEGFFRC